MDSAELDYLNWNIPTGVGTASSSENRITLGLYQAHELPIIHDWKNQVDISFLTCRTVQRMSLTERQQRFKEKVPFAYAMRRIADNQFLGEFNLYGYNAKNRSIGVGYFTGKDYRQQGYTKEGLLLLIDYLFKVVGLNKVMADTGAFNQGSIALLESSGFQQDGCLRQHQLFEGVLHDRLLFSLLAQDWKLAQDGKAEQTI